MSPATLPRPDFNIHRDIPLKTARSIEGDSMRISALTAVSEAQALTGDIAAARETAAEALQIARSIPSASERVFGLAQVAETFHQISR